MCVCPCVCVSVCVYVNVFMCVCVLCASVRMISLCVKILFSQSKSIINQNKDNDSFEALLDHSSKQYYNINTHNTTLFLHNSLPTGAMRCGM